MALQPLVLCLALAIAAPSVTRAQAGDSTPPLVLEPGDVVKVTVWREKDLGGQYEVDEVGRLTLPMIGIVRVTGRSWDALRDSLMGEYARQLRNPSVSLVPMRRVLVLGEVTKPGPYLADPTLSLAGVVALAGGATPNGDLRRVRVVRKGQTIFKAASVESLLGTGVHSNDQVFVDRRSWLERNGAFVASALLTTASIAVTLLRR